MLSSFLHEPKRKGNRGDRPLWWIASYRFVSDSIGEWGTARLAGEIFFPLANSRPDEYSNRRLAPSVDAR